MSEQRTRILDRSSPGVSVAVLCLGGLVAALTQTMIMPIQGQLPHLLDTTPASSTWVVTITLLSAAVSMPVSGRLADMLGKQRMLAVCALLLLAGSVVCALSHDLVPVLVGRSLQGCAMGFIPIGIALIREITSPRAAATAIGAMSATMGVGGAIGLPLTAWIAQAGDWHTLFWVTTGLAAVVALLTVVAVPHVADAEPGRFDIVGALGLAVGLVTFLVAVSRGTTWGWADPRTVAGIIGGITMLIAWGWYELRQDDPLVDLRTTVRVPILLTNLSAVAVGFGMLAQSIVLPQLLQLPVSSGFGLGQSLLATGLWLAPGGLMMMLFAPLSGRLIDGAGAKTALALGATVIGVGYLTSLLLMDAPWQLLLASCISTAGVGIGFAAMPSLILDAAPRREAAAAVGLNGVMRSIGTTLAAAVMGTVLTSSPVAIDGNMVPPQEAFQLCFLIGATAAFAGAGIALLIPRNPADPTRSEAVAPETADHR